MDSGRILIYSPSITLPSRQLPGLLCFGAGFFSLIVLFILSFASFLGATLIVSSSSLARVARKGISSVLSLDVHCGGYGRTFVFASGHNCQPSDGLGERGEGT
jgi:hypothetical protein